MKIAIAADHGGYSLKEVLVPWLHDCGYEVLDLGAPAYDGTDDYPDFAFLVGEAIQAGKADRGIVICGSGVGACIAANKLTGIRACLCHDTYSARQGVEHDDMNLLCLGGRIVGDELARELIRAFLGADFQPEDRFLRRRHKIIAREEKE
ncbi:MAG: RpiB/LacA/LacB family sugar-phosphate isomerase [Chloroflexota bacterium]|nr:RpiB/LacA/LacB family sugar-phosphate isomerase [Chloroflexota bacterium]